MCPHPQEIGEHEAADEREDGRDTEGGRDGRAEQRSDKTSEELRGRREAVDLTARFGRRDRPMIALALGKMPPKNTPTPKRSATKAQIFVRRTLAAA